ncbi:XRE family transcriptional regulator [Pseudomonas sp. FP2196]|uniref:XRE family transcriptional regulator n=1 Tax=Pseudomonas sp. FP2196 TaxID=2954086 RepID=UPI00273702FE|nr:XRE family transcriptional regulator [Pseudomonas sp. FP2196]WLH34346.1 XRE family transcriptional regulator [Pseudomonas sp. FP2196]
MSEIEESAGNVYQDLDLANADEMQMKSNCVAKLASLIEHADIGESEAANRLGLPLKNLQSIIRGQFRDEPNDTIASYLAKISEVTGSPS